MRVEIANSIDEVATEGWNRLAGTDCPLVRHEFLAAAEKSGSVSAGTGWQPRHFLLRDGRGRLVGAMPLYEKNHSWGEFVFDWSWAHAYERAGLDYYPKLVSMVPFTPATGKRLLTATPKHREALVEACKQWLAEQGHSSLHILFPHAAEHRTYEECGLRLRRDCQFHWFNQGYSSFDDFLASFSSAKRKKVRRERRRVAEEGIRIRRMTGADLDVDIWRDVYALISTSFYRRGGRPYLSLEFFLELTERLPDNVLVVLAEKNRLPIAASVFFDSADALYGRYWGADGHYHSLHFETCYYQGIEHCIAQNRQRFEPGTQGEHKISRGFVPVATWSAHWLQQPAFFDAVHRFVRAEARHIDQYMQIVRDHSPYRRDQQQ